MTDGDDDGSKYVCLWTSPLCVLSAYTSTLTLYKSMQLSLLGQTLLTDGMIAKM